MRSGRAAFFFIALSAAVASANRLPLLPKTANIVIGVAGRDEHDQASEVCKDFRVTAQQIRARFRTYRVLSPGELHDRYVLAPCWVDGKIIVRGKAFTWRYRPGRTLETTYPDGVDKMLGGKPSDRLSGE